MKSQNCAKSDRNFDVLGPPNFDGGRAIKISDRIL